MKTIQKILMFLLLLLLGGCGAIVVEVGGGLFSGYDKLSKIQQKRFIKVEHHQSLSAGDKSIYLISGATLNTMANHHNATLIYFWSPNCTSKVCYSLSSIKNYCVEKNFNFILIAEYINLERFEEAFDAGITIYMPNFLNYGIDYCNRYMRVFKKELLQQKYDKITNLIGIC
ncbi:MAG: hypothetical protein HC892_11410 [Saprospiraceae bacterium]|nr:hypothetical protein [Saprospiraceae bacterium]